MLELGGSAAEASPRAACPAAAVVTGGGPAMKVVQGDIRLATPTVTVGDASLTVSTAQVRRGSTELDLTVLDTSTTRPDTVTTNRKDLVEIAQGIAGGAEQSWCFRQAPKGSGDLVVRVTSHVTTAKRGKVFPVIEHGTDGVLLRYPDLMNVVYHHGIWIDGSGRQSPVPARVVDGAIELAVPAEVLAASRFPATLDPKIIVPRL